MTLEEAETEIRRTVKDEYLKQTPKTALDAKIKKIIRNALKKITIADLANAAVRSLWNFYIRQYEEIRKLHGERLLILLALLKLGGEKTAVFPSERAARETLGKGPSVRGEALTLEEFARLSDELGGRRKTGV